MAHTAGPWHYYEATNTNAWSISGGPGAEDVAKVYGREYKSRRTGETKLSARCLDNAKLIAAAPDMLAAICEMLSWVEGGPGVDAARAAAQSAGHMH